MNNATATRYVNGQADSMRETQIGRLSDVLEWVRDQVATDSRGFDITYQIRPFERRSGKDRRKS